MTSLVQFRHLVEKIISDKFGIEANLPAVILQPAPKHVEADLCLPWAMSAAKVLRKNPAETAAALALEIAKAEGVEKAWATQGFVNVIFKTQVLKEFLRQLKYNRKDYGYLKLPHPPQEKILLEFVSANPTGPLHVASGRGASLGDSLVRIMRALGMNADSEFYVNDIGNQALLLGESLKARKEGKEPPENGYHGDYLIDMVAKLPAEADGWKAEQFSSFAIEYLLATHKADMELFRVPFTRWFRESELKKDNAVNDTLAMLKNTGKAYEREGAVWFGSTNFEGEDKDDKDRVLVRADGRPTYFLSDIAYHRGKYARGYDRLIDIWGADHHGYVPRMKAAMEAIGKDPKTFEVIIHQLVHLNKGGVAVKMSKRAGEFITLRELAQDVGVDACRFFFASRTPNSHLNFDIELAKKQTQENPVYYVQYVHARIASVFAAAKKLGMKADDASVLSDKLEPHERQVIIKMFWFQSILETCVNDLSPHHLSTYLMELAGLYHTFYDTCRIIEENDSATTHSRLTICEAVQTVISDGLGLIGVNAPDRM